MRAGFVCTVLMVFTTLSLAQPKIEIVGGTKFDFGDINRGKKVDKKVIVKNSGNKTLELGRVDVSCGCTGTVVSQTAIEPGKTGEVLISFNSQNFSGKIHKTVTINSNAANSPTVVEFEGNVFQEIAVEPQQFWFQNAEVGRSTLTKVTITNNSKESIKLTKYTTNVEGFSLSLPNTPLKPGESVELTAELKSSKPVHVLNDGVSIKTTSKSEPELFVRIFGSVKEFKFQ